MVATTGALLGTSTTAHETGGSVGIGRGGSGASFLSSDSDQAARAPEAGVLRQPDDLTRLLGDVDWSARAVHANVGNKPAGPLFYTLEQCETCSEENVAKSYCKDTAGDMRKRLALISGGRLLESKYSWSLLWMCRPDAYPNLKETLDRGVVHAALQPGQLINYFPGARAEVFPKDTLCAHVSAAWRAARHDFFAPCFVLPEQRSEFDAFQSSEEEAMQQLRQRGVPPPPKPVADATTAAARSAAMDVQLAATSDALSGRLVWVVKDAENFGGRGIRFHRGRLRDGFLVGKQLYVQRFVDPPALIHGRKFDLRLYALVPSFDPFRVYLYARGYARRTLVPFTADLNDRLAHITNHDEQIRFARAKHDQQLVARNMTIPPGGPEDSPHVTKWTLRGVMQYFREQGHDTRLLWARVRSAVARTLAAVATPLTCRANRHGHSYPCGSAFHHFGVDIMVDATMRPQVLEVNTQPMLRFNDVAIAQLQTGMIADQLHMVGLLPGEPTHVRVHALATAPEAASLSHAQVLHLGFMLREYSHRGLFDLAFPDPWAPAEVPHWRDVAHVLPHATLDAPVYEAFTQILASPDAQRRIRAFVGAYVPDFV